MDKIKEIEDKFFKLGDYDPVKIDAFVRETVEGENDSGVVKLAKPALFDEVDAFKFLNDRGTGRIYQGVRSLELISRSLRGVPASSLTLFDAKIMAYGPEDMRTAGQETARNIITANLGISNYYDAVRSVDNVEVAKYKEFMDKVAKEVKSGGFSAAVSLSEALVRTKAIVRLALNNRG